MRRLLITVAMLMIPLCLAGQTRRYTVSGHVKDAASGEMMIGAVVNPAGSTSGTVTNAYGFYSIQLPAGDYELCCSSLGYDADTVRINLKGNLKQDFTLKESLLYLEGSTVTAVSKREKLLRPETSLVNLSGDFIKKVPVLFGETDIIKVIQMMPGVQAPSEGSTGFSVRGGGVDQNLVLMDEAPVYNAGHFMGFFSVFNNDAVKTGDLYKGDISAKYGGRLSSLLDIHTIDGNMQEFGGSLSIGLISSKVLLEGPIVKDKASFMVAARRTYIDMFFPLFVALKGDKMFFHDINAKANWIINDNNRLYLSVFNGKDVFAMANSEAADLDLDMGFANNTQSLRWNHIFSPKLFSNFTLLNSHYDFDTMLEFSATDIDMGSRLNNQGFKADFNWFANASNTVSFGLQGNRYVISPAEFKPRSEGIFSEYTYPQTTALAPDFYIQNEQRIGTKVTLRYGLRLSNFATMGERTQRYYDAAHKLDHTEDFAKGETVKAWHALEPRFSSSFSLSPSMSVKAAWSRNVQYIQQAIYSISGSPLDIWFSASPNIKPQVSDQYTVGFFKNFLDDALETSVELFYKDNRNTIDFKDHPNVIMNEDMEAEIRTGNSFARGAEFMVKYEKGKFDGWVSYTLSQARYKIPEINEGKPYDSPMNHKHSVSVIGTYRFGKRLSASADWVYYSGAPTTYPSGVIQVGDTRVPFYSDRNQDHFPDYHRLDLSLTLQGRRVPSGKRGHGEWNFSVYNVYSRHNAWALDFHYNDDTEEITARKVYLFTAIPSISYTLTL
ncbi:MAG: TonB-dependent receptor [Bacteroidales bacterium]|nr:TonB-dependent receptor [Bacteroidales bacterium]